MQPININITNIGMGSDNNNDLTATVNYSFNDPDAQVTAQGSVTVLRSKFFEHSESEKKIKEMVIENLHERLVLGNGGASE